MNDIVTPRDTKQKLTDTLQNVYISMQPADVIIEALLAKPKHELEDHLPQIQKILKVRKQICKSKKKVSCVVVIVTVSVRNAMEKNLVDGV